MRPLLLSEIAVICNGDLYGQDQLVQMVVTDSREAAGGKLFVALAGEHADGHDFIEGLQDSGCKAALVERKIEAPVSQVVVSDNYRALADLAAWVRKQLGSIVIAITGSSGKTSTRTMLAGILQQAGSVSATLGNRNNELGVPLTLLAADNEADYLIVEMGAAKTGDIAYLMAIADPDISTITNVGVAHLGRFGSEANIARTKAEIFTGLKDSGTAVVNVDDNYAAQWQDMLADKRMLGFSLLDDNADVYLTELDMDNNGSRFVLHYAGQAVDICLHVPGRHHVANAVCAAACAFAAGVEAQDVAKGLAAFTGVEGRMQMKKAACGAVVIDDSYNANPSSVKAAVDVLSARAGKRYLVLGDMAELGQSSQGLHEDVGRYAAEKGIDELLTLGRDSRYASDAFAEGAKHFDEKAKLAEYLLAKLADNDVVLVKGSRSSAMEDVVRMLEQRVVA